MFKLVYIKWFLRDGDHNEYRKFLHFFLMDSIVVAMRLCVLMEIASQPIFFLICHLDNSTKQLVLLVVTQAWQAPRTNIISISN
jgi:hypothetical protein